VNENERPKAERVRVRGASVSVAKVAKLGKLPVRFALGLQWMPVQPDRYGQKWNVQVIVAPVLPKLIKGNLVDPSHMTFGLGK